MAIEPSPTCEGGRGCIPFPSKVFVSFIKVNVILPTGIQTRLFNSSIRPAIHYSIMPPADLA